MPGHAEMQERMWHVKQGKIPAVHMSSHLNITQSLCEMGIYHSHNVIEM